MTMRAALRGGTAVRWAYGVIVTLCAALAVLVHHEMPTAGASSMPGMSHAAMPAATHDPHATPDSTQPSVSGPSRHGLDEDGCAGTGMQHCGAASVPSTQLAAPDHGELRPPFDLPRISPGHAPGAVVSRAPPDLSVLSQLRI